LTYSEDWKLSRGRVAPDPFAQGLPEVLALTPAPTEKAIAWIAEAQRLEREGNAIERYFMLEIGSKHM
jgi:hypothetical protein